MNAPHRTRALFLAAVALWGIPRRVQGLDPERQITQYASMKWGAGTLPGPGVRAAVQTPDGYLWLGTSAGLVRFDGSRFVVHDAASTTGFGEGDVTALTVGPDGALFYGTTAGDIVRVQDGRFTPVPHAAGRGWVCALHAARDGTLWFALYGRTVHWWTAGGGVGTLAKDITLRPTPLAFAEDVHGTVWFGTEHDGVRTADGRVPTGPLPKDAIEALHWDRSGALWMGTRNGLYCLEDGRLRRFGRKDGLAHDAVLTILEDSRRSLWVGTKGGLSRLRGGRWTSFTVAEGLSENGVRSLLEDRDGNLWIGTADGVHCLSDPRFITYGRHEGVSDPSISSVALGSGGSVWAGSDEGMVFRLRDGAVEQFALPRRPGQRSVLSLHEARDGSVWVRSNNRLFRLEGGRATEYTGAAWGGRVTALSEDEHGLLLYIKGIKGRGLARFDGRRFVPWPSPLPDLDYVHQIHVGGDGTLWIAGPQGLTRVRGGAHRTYTVADGLPGKRVRWVSEDRDGSLWLATEGGLARLQQGRLQVLTPAQGLPESYLRLVLDDGLRSLWVVSTGAVFRLDKQEVLDVLAGRRAQVLPTLFDAADGLRSSETVLSNNPGARDARGRLWFATASGVAVIDPGRLSAGAPGPALHFQALRVDGRVDEPAAGQELHYGPGRGDVTIEYAPLRFGSLNGMRYRHRLDGVDRDWVEGRGRSASYRLAPGSYSFSVVASNAEGAWNRPPATLRFSIRPPFYRYWPFYAALAAGLLLVAAHRLRVRRMRERFAAILGERTRIARELHDTLAQGLAGTSIQLDAALTMLPERPAAARDSVALGRAMVRSTIEEVRRSIWVLRAQTAERPARLQSALGDSLRQLTEQAGLVPRFRVDGEPRALPTELERSLLRIAHEAVTNAVRHSGATTLAVDLAFEPDCVHLRVRDDGRGFDPEPWLRRRRGDRFGLLGMSERARGLGGELQVRSREGEGTEVGCRLPYRRHERPVAGGGTPGASL